MNYNIQSWPTKVQSAKFTELLAYNEAEGGITPSTPQWSGRIAAQRWYHGNPTIKPLYQFAYDAAGRLTSATYSQNVYMQGRRPKYSENFAYDAMGNITSLTRQGFLYSATWGDIDDLVMEYEGNRIVKCDDAAASQPTYSEAHHFADLADASAEYEYDENGNMTNFSIKREQSKLVCSAESEEFGMKFNRNIFIIFAAPQHEKRTCSFYPAFGLQKISSIQYNSLNLRPKAVKIGCISGMKAKTSLFALHSTRFALSLPSHITIKGDGMNTHIDNTYDAAGNKLRTTVGRQRVIGPIRPFSLGEGAEPQGGGLTGGLPGGEIVNPIPSSTLITTDYCGNAIYRGDTLSMLLTEEGYVTFASDSVPVYHYYLKDHLGSIRVVFDQSGTVEQRNDYYASGALMYTSTGGTVQPYKFGGKELERTAGLDEYDFGARWMDPVIGARFTTMDPLAEKYYGISPYAYCGGDPVNAFDPDGRRINYYNSADETWYTYYNGHFYRYGDIDFNRKTNIVTILGKPVNVSNQPNDYMTKTLNYLNQMASSKDEIIREVVAAAQNNTKYEINIQRHLGNGKRGSKTHGESRSSYIFLDFEHDLKSGSDMSKNHATEYDIFGHELKHGYDNMYYLGSSQFYKNENFTIDEFYTVMFENRLRKDERNRFMRNNYGRVPIPYQYRKFFMFNRNNGKRYEVK